MSLTRDGSFAVLSDSPWHGKPKKRRSVSRRPRDDMDRLRLPDDVSQAIRPERRGPDLPRSRRSGSGGPSLRRRDGNIDGQQGLPLAGRVSAFFFLFRVSIFAKRPEILRDYTAYRTEKPVRHPRCEFQIKTLKPNDAIEWKKNIRMEYFYLPICLQVNFPLERLENYDRTLHAPGLRTFIAAISRAL